jgi:EAL and modified HD-GYP domain-containing signal transduction protein
MSSARELKKQTLMARQPIVNNKKETIAYELLYRSDQADNNAVFDFSGSEATINVVLNSFTSIYQNKKSRRMPAFINFTYDLLVNERLPVLPTNQIVIEILEDVQVTDELISSIKSLRKKGYTIALDDFIYDEKFVPLLKLCQIVKVDVINMSFEQVEEQVDHLKPYNVVLLAEKIETHEMFNHCNSIGFKLFQGYFLSKPEIVEGVKVEPSKIHLLKIIKELEKPDVSSKSLEKIILRDPVLTLKILRIVNSSANQLVREIQSIEEAINLLGIPEVKKWALIIVVASNSDKPEELSRQLLARGRMFENLAQATGIKNITSYMMVGIMSGVNTLLDMELEELLEQISLGSEINEAIIEGLGDMGELLHSSINFNNGEWSNVSKQIDDATYNTAYLESLNWARESLEVIS